MSLASQVTALAGAIRDKLNTMTPRLLPAGGGTGQVLAKVNTTDYNVTWVTPSSGGGGGGIAGRSVDVDITSPKTAQSFTIADAAALTSHKVIGAPAARAPVGGYIDQVELNPIVVQGACTVDGQVTLIISSASGHPIMGEYAIDYYLA